MIKLVCTECNQVWYTSNTVSSGDCDYCHGQLVKVDERLSDENASANIGVIKEIAYTYE
jgi:hypothetical protein